MAQNVVFNGVVYSIPHVGDDDYGQNLTDYFIAIASGALQKTGGTFTLTADANFGASFGLRSRYFSSRDAIIATDGLVRMSVTNSIGWRNNANAANLLLAVNGSDQLTFNGIVVQPASGLTASRALVTSAGGAIEVATTTAIEIGFVNGVTSAIQTQLNGKQATGSYITALTGEVTASGPGSVAATVDNAAVIAKVLTGYTSGAGTVAATDTILQAIQKVDGNDALKQPLATLTTKGDLYVATAPSTVARQGIGTNGQVLVADSAQANGLKWSNAPQGLKNYVVVNADLEQGSTTGYSLGTATLTSAFPSGVPTFGSGAAGTLSLSAISSGQLAGTYSLGYTSSGATTAGNFVATDAFSVDLEGQAKVMQFKIAYKAVTNPTNGNFSGTSSNSFGVAVYDVTNSTWIQPAGVFNIVQSSGVGIASGTFQTSVDGTSYRLVFYNANASAGAITMYLDDFFVGPQITAAGAAMSDWETSSTTLNSTTSVSSTTVRKRRVGDNLEMQVAVAYSGAGAASAFSFSLPTGLTIDTAKLANSTNAVPIVGHASKYSTNFRFWEAVYTNSTTIGLIQDNATGYIGSNSFVNGDIIYVWVSVPIVGWSSQSVMSSDTDTRVIAAYATGIPASVTSGNPIIYPTVTRDTSGAYNSTTGRYLVQVPGFYQISIGGACGVGPSARLQIYNNAVAGPIIGFLNSTDGLYAGSGIVYANAGEQLDVRPSQNMASFAATGSLSINRLSGPATIAATESVNAGYYMSANAGSSTTQTANFDTRLYDSHNAVTAAAAGTGTWKFTAPVSGTYKISGPAFLTTAATPNAVLYKNGIAFQTAGSIPTQGAYSCGIKLIAGDYVDLRLSSSLTLSGGAPGTSNSSIFIERIGN